MPMVVGLLTLELRLPGNGSLKGKRHVLKPLISRLRHEFNVSVSEIEAQDAWQRAVLGVACVSSSTEYVHGLLTEVARAVESWRMDLEVVDYEIELIE
ncbi:MAG: DUF503 domain-containing protein [Anaerolineae bacterium]|nr:DUF503 domain-containing protein [Anaerolineae bacterium]MDW8098498.1 DUF503 domain-containing protein [Anaerolineae bacterium]